MNAATSAGLRMDRLTDFRPPMRVGVPRAGLRERQADLVLAQRFAVSVEQRVEVGQDQLAPSPGLVQVFLSAGLHHAATSLRNA